MKRLRFLRLIGGVRLSGDYKYLSNNLRWLCWRGFPLKFIPEDFNLGKIVAIHLMYSSLTHLWEDSRIYTLADYDVEFISDDDEFILYVDDISLDEQGTDIHTADYDVKFISEDNSLDEYFSRSDDEQIDSINFINFRS
ncbi:hypothetical protein M0R45_025005 [Rubus argutus]|uniref:Uncharacterized protein n=1 Tax=Rubus argutus TaxID=59490 RepID=A0AAW1WVT3_RUBAR